MAKKTMTLNLTDTEMEVLEALCKQKQMSKTLIMRQALRLYQRVEESLDAGGKLFIEDESTKEKSEIMML